MKNHLILIQPFNSLGRPLRRLSWILLMLLAGGLFCPAFSQEVPVKKPASKLQEQSQSIAKLNQKLKAGQNTNIAKTKSGHKLPQNAPTTKQPNLTPPKSSAKTSGTKIATTPPKPSNNMQITAPASRKIPGTNPGSRATQINPDNRAAQLSPTNRAAQLHPSTKINQLHPNKESPIPKAKSTKKTRPIRDIKYKREHYKAKRNNG